MSQGPLSISCRVPEESIFLYVVACCQMVQSQPVLFVAIRCVVEGAAATTKNPRLLRIIFQESTTKRRLKRTLTVSLFPLLFPFCSPMPAWNDE